MRLLKSQLDLRQKNGTDGVGDPEGGALENGMDSHLLELQSESSSSFLRPHFVFFIFIFIYTVYRIYMFIYIIYKRAVLCPSGDANRQISDLKFKLVKCEQEVTTLEQNVSVEGN